jgi:hypothetical protein
MAASASPTGTTATTADDQGLVSRVGKYFTIWRREYDGGWKVVLDGGSPDQREPSPDAAAPAPAAASPSPVPAPTAPGAKKPPAQGTREPVRG